MSNDPVPPEESSDRDVAGRNPGSPVLYAEMLPLVEAGATVAQAARRFGGDPDEVAEIAAGFARWRASEEESAEDGDLGAALAAVEQRVADLEDENRALRRRLADLRRLVSTAGDILDGERR